MEEAIWLTFDDAKDLSRESCSDLDKRPNVSAEPNTKIVRGHGVDGKGSAIFAEEQSIELREGEGVDLGDQWTISVWIKTPLPGRFCSILHGEHGSFLCFKDNCLAVDSESSSVPFLPSLSHLSLRLDDHVCAFPDIAEFFRSGRTGSGMWQNEAPKKAAEATQCCHLLSCGIAAGRGVRVVAENVMAAAAPPMAAHVRPVWSSFWSTE